MQLRERLAGRIAVVIGATLVAGAGAEEGTNATTVLPDVVVIGSQEALSRLPAAGEFLDADAIRFHTYDNIHKVLR